MIWRSRFPEAFIFGQYLQELGLLHGDLSMFLRGSGSVRVEARTKKSDRFLFRLEPNTIFAFSNMRVVLDLSSSSQLLVIMPRNGGL